MHDQQIINSIHVETLDINDPMQAAASQVYEKILNTEMSTRTAFIL